MALGLADFQAKVALLQKEISELEKQKSSICSEISSQRKGTTEVMHDKIAYENRIKQLELEVESLKEHIDSSRIQHFDYNHRIKDAEEKTTDLNGSILSLKQENDRLQALHSKYEENIEIIKNNRGIMLKNSQKQENELNDKFYDLVAKVDKAEKKLFILNSQSDDIELQKAKLSKREKEFGIYFNRLKNKAKKLGIKLLINQIIY